ncbi:hypothetical protein F4779DRAFT_642214 [Xylariaceae sp. FL0662B]|nr:hypothetical protein F4779DRAFT_642214 [Xylariaceae sp. FL0662B]
MLPLNPPVPPGPTAAAKNLALQGGNSDAVFQIENDGTLSTVIIGQTTTITGGGALGAEGKVLHLSISDFTVDDFGKLYRSCDNCKSMYKRHVTLTGITATLSEVL